MKLNNLVAGMAAAGGGLILLTTVLFKDEIRDWLYAIRRVRTWGDLLAQKPIQLSDGAIVRLGIEDTRCAQGSGVLLYCLTEGYDPGSRTEENETSFGPLDVSVVEEGAKPTERFVWQGKRLLDLGKESASTRWLFVRPILVPRGGRYHVTVSERGNALRHATVEGTGETFHPWLTLERSDKLVTLARVGEGRTGRLREYSPCKGLPAYPAREGSIPLMEASFPGGVDPARRLPGLFPEPLAPAELEIRKEEDSFVVISKSRIRPIGNNFAARWWVNGLPRIPQPDERSEILRSGAVPPDGFQFHLDFDWSGGDVRSGDRLSLQLMYSDRGWSMMDGGEFPAGLLSAEQRIYSSNRIELTVP